MGNKKNQQEDSIGQRPIFMREKKKKTTCRAERTSGPGDRTNKSAKRVNIFIREMIFPVLSAVVLSQTQKKLHKAIKQTPCNAQGAGRGASK